MKKNDVKVGTTYAIKVSGNVVPVKITEEKWVGDRHVGWIGVNTQTNRSVRIKSAMKLRAELNGHAPSKKAHSEQLGDDKDTGKKEEKSTGSDAGKGPAKPASRAKGTKKAKAPKVPKNKRVSGLDAAAQVLAAARKPMNCKEILADIMAKRLWTSSGKTPEATLYAAIIREIAARKKEARFRKTERGKFEATASA